jgi:Protein of unknown function (DUF3341)
MTTTPTSAPWGLLAEFASAEALLEAARAARAAGYARAEAYAPFAVEGLAEALGFTRSRVPAATLVGALCGGLGAYFMQWYAAVVDYPEVIGGRPLHSWPMFVPVSFEMAILFGTLAALAAFAIGSDLPRLQHPLFAAPDFELATRNRFFLCLRSDDPAFDRAGADALLDRLAPLRVSEVPGS